MLIPIRKVISVLMLIQIMKVISVLMLIQIMKVISVLMPITIKKVISVLMLIPICKAIVRKIYVALNLYSCGLLCCTQLIFQWTLNAIYDNIADIV